MKTGTTPTPFAVKAKQEQRRREKRISAHLRYVRQLTLAKAPTSSYACPHCHFLTVTLIPKSHQVEPSKPYFDTATTCPNCEVILFVKKYCDGKITVVNATTLM